MIQRFLNDDNGATAIEYAVIAGLIFLVIISAIVPMGFKLETIFGSVANGMTLAP